MKHLLVLVAASCGGGGHAGDAPEPDAATGWVAEPVDPVPTSVLGVRVVLVLVLVLGWLGASACGGDREDPQQVVPPPATPAAVDARIARIPDAAAPDPTPVRQPAPDCAFSGALEEITVRIDPSTGRGSLQRSSPGINHYRNLEVTVAVESPRSRALVFAAYGPRDYEPILNWHGPSVPREHLVAGKSVVARLVDEGGLLRIREVDVDLHTGMTYQTRDHAYPCAVIDGAFLRAHPDEFLPR